MQSIHPRRKRALGYIIVLCGSIVAVVGLFTISNRYPSASSMNVKLTSMGGLLAFLLAVFAVPFITFAWKYWKLTWEDAPLPPADDETHQVSVWCTTGAFALFGHRCSFNWNNSTQVITITAGSSENPQTIVEVPFKEVQWFDVTVGSVRIRVNGKTYTCSPISPIPTGFFWGPPRGAALVAAAIADSKILNAAGIPELANRLHAQGVNVRLDHIGKRFEAVFDVLFALLCAGVLVVGVISH